MAIQHEPQAASAAAAAARAAPTPIVALDVPSSRAALDLVERLPDADFFKVGLQLFTAAGPAVVRELRATGRRVFLDLKLHDIPNTVAGAVGAAAELNVQLLTLHAAGGAAMLGAARRAAGEPGSGGPALLAVTVLTSLSAAELGGAWGRAGVDTEIEAVRLARLAQAEGIDGVVASVREVAAIRTAARRLALLTPGIRLPGSEPGDQTRIATPAEAAALGVDYLVLGRTVTAAADPAAAYARVLVDLGAVT
jgi:orotidine-5'-phosphate decarboxylase